MEVKVGGNCRFSNNSQRCSLLDKYNCGCMIRLVWQFNISWGKCLDGNYSSTVYFLHSSSMSQISGYNGTVHHILQIRKWTKWSFLFGRLVLLWPINIWTSEIWEHYITTYWDDEMWQVHKYTNSQIQKYTLHNNMRKNVQKNTYISTQVHKYASHKYIGAQVQKYTST